MRKLLFLAVLFLSSCGYFGGMTIKQEVEVSQGVPTIYTWIWQNRQIKYSHYSTCDYASIAKTKTADSIDAVNNMQLLEKYNN